MDQSRVEAAIAQLEGAGIEVTVRSLRKALGGGSMTDVTAALQGIRQRRDLISATEREIPQQLQEKLQLLIAEMWSAISSESQRRIEIVQSGAAKAASDHSRVESSLSRDVDDLEAQLRSLQCECRSKQLSLVAQREELEAERRDRHVLQARFDDLKTQLAEARERESAIIGALHLEPLKTKNPRETPETLETPGTPETSETPETLETPEKQAGTSIASDPEPLDFDQPWTGNIGTSAAQAIRRTVSAHGPVKMLKLRDLTPEFQGQDLVMLSKRTDALTKWFSDISFSNGIVSVRAHPEKE